MANSRHASLKDTSIAQAIRRAAVMEEEGALGRAEALYRDILESTPDHFDALHHLGVLRQQQGDPAEALKLIAAALKLDAGSPDALSNYGVALDALDRHEEAVVAFEQALALAPDQPDALRKRGNALFALGRIEEALMSYESVLNQNPNDVETVVSCGNALAELDYLDAAERHYRIALALAPDCEAAKWNKSLLDLARGRFAPGWENYERRFKCLQGAAPRPYPQPRWDGGTVEGTLLVWGERDLGDQVLLSSMVPDLVGRAREVVLEVDPRLVPLMARSFPSVKVAGLGPSPYSGRVDAHAALGDLGRHLRPNWESFPQRARGHLVADRDRAADLRERLTRAKRNVIGLSWQNAGPAPATGRVELRDFASLLRIPDCCFVDLDAGDTTAERAAAARELGAEFERLDGIDNGDDMDGRAALIAACDLVVTVSNTTAHLAGALGRPAWVLVPSGGAHAWYWFKERIDSPWYPHVCLCRRDGAEPWSDVVNAAVREIAAFVATN